MCVGHTFYFYSVRIPVCRHILFSFHATSFEFYEYRVVATAMHWTAFLQHNIFGLFPKKLT